MFSIPTRYALWNIGLISGGFCRRFLAREPLSTISPITHPIIRNCNSLLVVFLFTLLSACGTKVDDPESAAERIRELVADKIRPGFNENTQIANINLQRSELVSLLPELSEYPIVYGERDTAQTEVVEIFTSSEKAGRGRDGFYIELADAFNQQRLTLSNGKRASIAIRKIASGLGTQFMLANRYIPDAFSPSNALWGKMLQANGVEVDVIAQRTAPNTAGIVVKKNRLDDITTNNKLDLEKLVTNVSNGSFAMGYTNPFQSSTGLNFLLTVLHTFAKGNEAEMLSPEIASAFETFQTGVPFVAQTTLQMRDAAQGSGVLDALVMEHQTWVNVKGMKDYTFVPFGIRHDSPLYATPEASADEREVLSLFADFITRQQTSASNFGFGRNIDYPNAYEIDDVSIIADSQRLWKQKKSGGRPIAAVFVADVSGSMGEQRMVNLKKALTESADLINSSNAIGLVSYHELVNVDLFVRPFSVQQKALFIGAVQRLTAGGKTATNDAVVVAANMLLDFKKENPDHKLVLFVLSDGKTNRGLEFDAVEQTLEYAGIPIHAIAYEISSEHLKALATLSEGAYIESSTGSASYRIGNLLNSEM